MIFNILKYLPEKTKIIAKPEINNNLFGQEKLVDLCSLFGVSLKNISRYKNGTRAIPLRLFLALLAYRNTNIESIQNNIQVKIDKSGKYLRIGPLIEITPEWVYISELIKGDGSITPNFWYIRFVNKERSLIKDVKDFFLSLGVSEKRMDIREVNNVQFLTVRCYLLAYLFYKILGVFPGEKSAIIDIPAFVMNDLSLGRAAVRGAFDAEGSVTFTGSRAVSISSNSKMWLLKHKIILNRLKIKSRIYEDNSYRKRIIYRLKIYGIINIKRFNEEIRPAHKKRSSKLYEIVNSYTKNPQFIYHKDILLCIQRGINRKNEIAHNLKISLLTTGNNLHKLRERKCILPYEKVYSNKGIYFRYKLTKTGEKYLKNELIPFFD
jgi:hypothetical protein